MIKILENLRDLHLEPGIIRYQTLHQRKSKSHWKSSKIQREALNFRRELKLKLTGVLWKNLVNLKENATGSPKHSSFGLAINYDLTNLRKHFIFPEKISIKNWDFPIYYHSFLRFVMYYSQVKLDHFAGKGFYVSQWDFSHLQHCGREFPVQYFCLQNYWEIHLVEWRGWQRKRQLLVPNSRF